jgi:hypothetical protein
MSVRAINAINVFWRKGEHTNSMRFYVHEGSSPVVVANAVVNQMGGTLERWVEAEESRFRIGDEVTVDMKAFSELMGAELREYARYHNFFTVHGWMDAKAAYYRRIKKHIDAGHVLRVFDAPRIDSHHNGSWAVSISVNGSRLLHESLVLPVSILTPTHELEGATA